MRSTGFHKLLFLLFITAFFIGAQKLIPPYEKHEWLAPLAPTGITSMNGHIFACTEAGWILKTSLDGFELQKWRNLDLPAIDIATFKKKLYILTKNGLYNLNGEKILNFKNGKKLIERKNGLYILTENSLIKFTEEEKTSLPLKSSPLETRTFGKNIVILTRDSIVIVSTPEFKSREISLPGSIDSYEVYSEVKTRTLFDMYEKQGLLVTLSDSKKGNFKVSLFDYKQGHLLWTKEFHKKVAATGFWNGKVFIITNFTSIRMEEKSHLYLYSLDGKPIISGFEFDYPVSRAYLFQKRKFLILNGKYKFFEIFYKNLQYRYSIEFPSNDAYIYRLKFKDIDGNGEKDILAISFSNLPARQLRSKWVAVLLLKIRESLQNMEENYRSSLKLEKKWKLWKALEYNEASMTIAQFLAPERMPELIKSHRRILRKISAWLYIKNYLPYFLIALVFSFLLYLIIKLSLKLKRSGNPPDYVLEKLSGSNFTHQLLHILQLLLNTDDEKLEENFEKYRKELEGLLSYFMNFKKHFISASLDWDESFKRVKKALRKLLCGRISRAKIEKAYNAVEELAVKIRSLRGSVIENALKPAISSIIPEAERRGIKVDVDLQASSGTFGVFYPEKLQEFRNAFYSILQNSVEAFDDFKPGNEGPTISISAEESFYHLYIVISDNGKGMDENTLALIFNPGFSTKRKDGGYGLVGVDKLFKKWGEIEVYSRPGEGTIVKIYMRINK